MFLSFYSIECVCRTDFESIWSSFRQINLFQKLTKNDKIGETEINHLQKFNVILFTKHRPCEFVDFYENLTRLKASRLHATFP